MADRRRSASRLTDRVSARLHRSAVFRRLFREVRSRAFPDHWSLLFGQVAVYSFLVVAVTGVFLMFFYDPSTALTRYDGPFPPLRGIEMSRALESTLQLSFEVRGGLLVRQLHNWSASLMIAALMVHILRIFFTGGFRKPRELNWLLLFGILFLSMAVGLTGIVLPDDLLSGSTLAVLDGVLKSIPVVGTWLAYLTFGGEFPSGAIAVFYPLHLLLPLAILAAMVLNGILAAHHRPAQFAGAGRTETNVVGRPFRVAAMKSGALFLLVAGMLTVVAATVTVNPIWNYGPADPGNASAGGGALWYLAFLDGAQRLVPPGWEIVVLDRTWTLAILAPVGLITLYFLIAMVYPYLERWVTADDREHHLLDRPRNAPTRTAIGAAGVTIYGTLWAAGGSDVIASALRLSVEDVVLALQITLALGPLVAFLVTKRVCLGLQLRGRETLLNGYESGRVTRLPGGRYVEERKPVGVEDRAKLSTYPTPSPQQVRPDADGRIRPSTRARAIVSRWFFEDRVPAARQEELEHR